MTTVPHVICFQPSLEAIAEVQVIANQFSAEYGRASGAVSTYEHVPVETSFADEPSCSFETKA
ncbi:MAG: hypothetical protein IPP63_19370 [Chloracidobacterium sp.]|nr:hypothetical protein [Chloracidobacterium sp.]